MTLRALDGCDPGVLKNLKGGEGKRTSGGDSNKLEN
jgi:hypothetical protein